MKIVIFLFLLVPACYSQDILDVEVIRGREVDFSYDPVDQSMSAFGKLTITVEDDKGRIVRTWAETPDPRSEDFYSTIVLPKGEYRIILVDKNKTVIGVSDYFKIK